MSKANKKVSAQRVTQSVVTPFPHDDFNETAEKFHDIKIRKLNIEFKSDAQKNLWTLIDSKEITVISGPAGTGKTHMAILKSLELLKNFPTLYKKIIISKPNIESGPGIGFLPGTVDEKLAPYLYSSKYLFSKILGEQKCNRMFERKQVEIQPMGYIRGINLDNCIFILDEAQNCTKKEIRTILTRIGENCKFLMLGDTGQVDTNIKTEDTGLYVAIKRLMHIPQIGVFEFSDADIVRNPLISIILERLNGEFK